MSHEKEPEPDESAIKAGMQSLWLGADFTGLSCSERYVTFLLLALLTEEHFGLCHEAGELDAAKALYEKMKVMVIEKAEFIRAQNATTAPGGEG